MGINNWFDPHLILYIYIEKQLKHKYKKIYSFSQSITLKHEYNYTHLPKYKNINFCKFINKISGCK